MADLQINTDEITAALKANLESFTPSVEQTTVGRVLEVGDGIARVSGLPNAAVNEMLRFENGLVGLALNLDEDSIGAVVLGDVEGIEEGQTVVATGDILSVPVGDGLLGQPLLSAEAVRRRRNEVKQLLRAGLAPAASAPTGGTS